MNPTSLLAATLLVAALSAQDVPADGSIPAGAWTVRELLARAEQALDLEITADPQQLAAATTEPLRLQYPVKLDAGSGREAVAALLSTRGLLLVDDNRGDLTVKATPNGAPGWLREVAVDCTVRELLDFPHRHAVVRVELDSTVPAELLHTQLRTATVVTSDVGVPIVEPGRGGMVLTGPAAAVRHAVAIGATMDPGIASEFTAPEPPIAILSSARGGTVELAAGTHSLRHLVDLLAKNAGIVIVASPALAASTATVVVTGPQQLAWERGSATLLQLLWQQRVQLLELDVRHGLYEAVLVPNSRQAPGMARASRRTTDLVPGLRDMPLYIGVPFRAPHLDATTLRTRAELALRARDLDATLLAACSTPDGLWITGLATAVADLLDDLQPAEQPSPESADAARHRRTTSRQLTASKPAPAEPTAAQVGCRAGTAGCVARRGCTNRPRDADHRTRPQHAASQLRGADHPSGSARGFRRRTTASIR